MGWLPPSVGVTASGTSPSGKVMSAVRKVIGIGIHALTFLVAVVIFYFGLGVGLAFNPTLGTLLWVAAFAVAGLNVFWMIRKPLWR